MAETISVLVDGLKIAGEIYRPQNRQNIHPTLCICHGIPAAPPDPTNRGYPLLAEMFSKEGFLTCIFNFRGAGTSEGNLDLLGWTRDLDAVISYLSRLDDVDDTRISLMGFSGGAAVSTYVAARDKRISSLVINASPAEFSMFTIGKGIESFLDQCRGIGTIRDNDFPPSIEEWEEHFQQVNPINWIDKVSPRPLLIIHGEMDELIDLDDARRLYEKAKEPKELFMIPEGSHRLRTNEMAIGAALTWLKKVNNIS